MINWAHPLSITLISGAIAVLIRFSVPSLPELLEHISNIAAAIARSWIRSAAIVFCFSLGISAIPSLIYSRVPDPLVHDEFAYLLQGDTFAHGRLTNPPHAMSEFLETFHVLQHPTYAAKFPIGQGLVLAIGFRLGLPILGVWLSVALACVAADWMLRAFVAPRWSLLGAMLFALHPLITWWSQSYWGGAVAMLGGALLIGAAARLMRPHPCIADSVLLGLGLAILANSRPLEGLILAILTLAPLAHPAARSVLVPGGNHRIARITLPALAILLPVAAFMLHYNERVTGDRFTLPYIAHARQYMVAPLLFGQPLNTPPPYHHPVFADFFAKMELNEFHAERWWKKWSMLATAYISPPTLIVPLTASMWALRRQRGLAFALFLCIALPALQTMITPWLRPAYMALLMAPLCLIIVAGLHELTRRRAYTLVLFVIVSQLVAAVVYIKPAGELAHTPLAVARAKLVDDLTRQGGQHLVLVTYGPHHQPLFDFVFNPADIDRAAVVFARSMGPEKDPELLDYFRARQVWDLYFDEGAYRVTKRGAD